MGAEHSSARLSKHPCDTLNYTSTHRPNQVAVGAINAIEYARTCEDPPAWSKARVPHRTRPIRLPRKPTHLHRHAQHERAHCRGKSTSYLVGDVPNSGTRRTSPCRAAFCRDATRRRSFKEAFTSPSIENRKEVLRQSVRPLPCHGSRPLRGLPNAARRIVDALDRRILVTSMERPRRIIADEHC